ncbi:MAG: hypothetical protein OXU66_00750 [Gammaproteobacteria bacterium]|nr:hypothetical protein [Gammaproteobacteria bacterium]MDD9894243.1 hypothetical protein [Gammaproteobacteria bacterium]MDD9957443.1 hypothetical protein [Gammaproteobacteria bacterium]
MQIAIALDKGMAMLDKSGPDKIFNLIEISALRFVSSGVGPIITDSNALIVDGTYFRRDN